MWTEYVEFAENNWHYVVAFLTLVGGFRGLKRAVPSIVGLFAAQLRAEYCMQREKEHLKYIASIKESLRRLEESSQE